MDGERETQRLRDELEDIAEALDRRDRFGEQAPAPDTAFGGRFQWESHGRTPRRPATLRENVAAGLALVRSRAPYGQMVVEPRRPSVLDRLRAAVGR